jgi:hypothetical protein
MVKKNDKEIMIARASPFAHKSTQRCRLSIPRSSIRAATLALDKRVALFLALDDNAIPFDPSHAATAVATAAATPPPPPSGITPIQSFEPVLNVQAAASFAFITILFAILQLRINAVSNAARRRSAALSALRVAESAQLSDPSSGDRVVTRARVEYESALREELSLRTILPGMRIVAPNDPSRDEEERAAAKRFLGWGGEEFGDDEEEGGNIGTGGNKGSVERDGGAARTDGRSDVGLSVSAKFILFGVASMLIVLLWTLSFDPMAVNTNLFG